MRVLRHWKMILGLLAIFAAGVGTGGFLAVAGIIKLVRHHSKPEVWVDARLKELDRRLRLTTEQRERIRQVMAGTVDQFHGIVDRGLGEFLRVVAESHDKVNAELTPEQQREWAALREEAMKRWRQFAREEVLKAPPKPL